MGNGTSIGRVRGLGASHSGSHHWLMQHYLGIGSLVLSAWLVTSIVLLPNLDYKTVREWLGHSVPAVLLGLFVLINLWHGRLGIQTVIEDYVHENANKFASMLVLNLVTFAAIAFAAFCVVRLALGGA
ncbi:MAG: sdhD [Novosphingobium sp.]|jgi:succinate dehydrogenase / fumarate reductase membrane anchor subunit|nr:sdhD [Novosphingobium sp.]